LKHSYIKPNVKSIFDVATTIWLLFTTLSVIVLLGFSSILGIKTGSYQEKIAQMKHDEATMKLKITDISEATELIKVKKMKAEEITTANEMLSGSIKNFFDLVPDQITLSKVELDTHGMTLYGITPTKDAYNFLLLSPLKSIFNKNNTMFILNEDGWYRFISKNISEKENVNE
jgi:hypothetical protein